MESNSVESTGCNVSFLMAFLHSIFNSINNGEIMKSLKFKALTIVILIWLGNPIFAGCGHCQSNKKAEKSAKSNSLVTIVPEGGQIEGLVISSCGKCNLGYKKKRGCSLTVQIGDTVYQVEGVKFHDHGNPHAGEGFCNAVRIAYVSGKVEKNVFHADTFTLIESPK